MQPIEVRFGNSLRKKRLGVKLPSGDTLSQEALAAKAGLHRNYVGLLERGKQIPSLLVVEKLAHALGTSLSELLRDVDKAKH